MKKLSALALVAVMALSFETSAFAAKPDKEVKSNNGNHYGQIKHQTPQYVPSPEERLLIDNLNLNLTANKVTQLVERVEYDPSLETVQVYYDGSPETFFVRHPAEFGEVIGCTVEPNMCPAWVMVGGYKDGYYEFRAPVETPEPTPEPFPPTSEYFAKLVEYTSHVIGTPIVGDNVYTLNGNTVVTIIFDRDVTNMFGAPYDGMSVEEYAQEGDGNRGLRDVYGIAGDLISAEIISNKVIATFSTVAPKPSTKNLGLTIEALNQISGGGMTLEQVNEIIGFEGVVTHHWYEVNNEGIQVRWADGTGKAINAVFRKDGGTEWSLVALGSDYIYIN